MKSGYLEGQCLAYLNNLDIFSRAVESWHSQGASQLACCGLFQMGYAIFSGGARVAYLHLGF